MESLKNQHHKGLEKIKIELASEQKGSSDSLMKTKDKYKRKAT